MSIRRFSDSKISSPILLAVITLLTYGVFIPYTGFYWDDWVFAWIAKFLGPAEFLPAFIQVRPFLIPIFITTTHLIPPVPIYWQVFMLIIRFLAAYGAWFALSRVWAHLKIQILAAALLFLVFPAYSQHWVAFTHINQEWIAFILYLFSLGMTASALRNPIRFRSYTLAAMVLFFEGLFATEYFFGMEPLRFLFIWVILSEHEADLKKSFIRVFRIWLPYLCLWLLNGLWLVWFYGAGYNAYDLEIIKEPIGNANFIYQVGDAIWKAGVYAWVQVLAATGRAITSPSSLGTYAIICLSFILLFPVLKLTGEPSAYSKKIPFQFILIGLIGLALGRIPSLAAGLPFRLQSSFDRFAISMMLGGCLFTVGLVEWLIKNALAKRLVLALLIALGIGQQFFSGNVFRRDWERQQEILWQLKWRIPSLEPNTVLLTDEIAVDYESDISLAGPLNWMYAPDYQRGNLPYLLLYIDSRLGGSLPSLEPGTGIQFPFRTVTFYGNTSQAVVIHFPENGCLHVLDPRLDDANIYNQKYRRVLEIVNLSNPSLIRKGELPMPDFLPEPKKAWCYFYTKAELAQQFQDWNAILALEKQAAVNNFTPNDPYEWLPFIEANAMHGDWKHAEEISDRALAHDVQIRKGVCSVWKRVQAQGHAGGEVQLEIQRMLSEFQCTP